MHSQLREPSELDTPLRPLKADQDRDREDDEIPAVPTLEKVAT